MNPRTTSYRRRQSLAAFLAGWILLVSACSSGRTAPGNLTQASTEQTLSELFNLSTVYQRIGRIAAGAPVPFVGSVALVAGRGDSAVAFVGLSMENRGFAFQRDGRTFAARYRVEMGFQRAGSAPIQVAREEVVRVGTFQETQRADESILLQQGFHLAPGIYQLAITVRDLGASKSSRAEHTVTVPSFAVASTTAPILVYQGTPRAAVGDSLGLLLNPRGTVSQGGGDSLVVYVEGYRFPGPTTVPLIVKDERDSIVVQDSIRFAGNRAVEARLVRVGSGAPPLGELSIEIGSGAAQQKVTAMVSFSRGWVITNYDNLLSLLRFFPPSPKLDELRKTKPGDRARLWREFWVASDPTPGTPENEALDTYFSRLAIANERFRDEGEQGWRSDRGEVYITLGDPDQVMETFPGADRRYIQWVYNNYRAVLIFEGQLGFSRLRLSPASRSEFARARSQVWGEYRQRTDR